MPLEIEFFPCVSRRYTNGHWGQILDFPSVFGLIEIVSAGNAEEEGISYVTRLNRLFSSISQLPKLTLFKKKIDIKPLKSLLICFLRDGLCEISLIGEGKIFLRRGKVLAPLLVREGMLTGEIRPGDCIVLLSQTAAKIFTSEETKLFSPRLTAKEIAEALNIRLTQVEQQAEGAVAVVVQIKGEKQLPVSSKTLSQPVPLSEKVRVFVSALRQVTRKPKFVPYTIVIVITVLFLVSVFLGIRRQQNDTVSKSRVQAVEQAQNLFNEGVALSDLQPIKSRENFQTAIELLIPYIGKNLPKGKEGKAIENLEKQIQDSLKIVSKIYTANVQLFYDASFLQKDRIVSQFTIGEDELAFVDTSAGMIAVVSLTSKDAEVLAGGAEYRSTKFLEFQDNQLFIVTQEGIKVIESGKEEVKNVLSPEDSWNAFTTYGGNLYGVNRSESKIIRYPKKENGYGEKEEYLDEDVHAELSKTSGIVIDGSVWLGSTIGKIFRYTQGRDDPFLIRGVEPPLGQHLEVFVSEDSQSVYVFDPEEKRIVLLSKEGTYQGQYVYGDTIQPTAFGVSPSKKKIFLLSDQKIYSFSIE